jgi:hypothetical protein
MQRERDEHAIERAKGGTHTIASGDSPGSWASAHLANWAPGFGRKALGRLSGGAR